MTKISKNFREIATEHSSLAMDNSNIAFLSSDRALIRLVDDTINLLNGRHSYKFPYSMKGDIISYYFSKPTDFFIPFEFFKNNYCRGLS